MEVSEKGEVKDESIFFFLTSISGKMKLTSVKMINNEEEVYLGRSGCNEKKHILMV